MKLEITKRATNKGRLKAARLYCITSGAVSGKTLEDRVESACKGGADIIQLREKNCSSKDLLALSRKIGKVCHHYNALFIVNDRLDIALTAGADGVHLGQDDLPVIEARQMVDSISSPGEYKSPSNFIIGQSTHSLEQALKAEAEGADYVGCGPIFSTPTKPGAPPVGLGLIQEYNNHLSIPFVAIGGIDETNIRTVFKSGAHCAAVVRAAFAKSHVEESVRLLKLNLN